jgi:hypothetical protein
MTVDPHELLSLAAAIFADTEWTSEDEADVPAPLSRDEAAARTNDRAVAAMGAKGGVRWSAR